MYFETPFLYVIYEFCFSVAILINIVARFYLLACLLSSVSLCPVGTSFLRRITWDAG